MRRQVILVLLVAVVFAYALPAVAQEAPGNLPDYSPDGGTSEQLRDEGGMLERAVASVIDGLTSIVKGIARAGGFHSLDRLIFNHGLDETQRQYLPFTPEQWALLDKWYNYIMVGFSGLVLLAVLVTAFKFINAPMNAEMKADASESMMRWIGAVLLVACAPVLVRALFWLNNAMVDTLFEIVERVLPGRVEQLPNFAADGMIEGLTDLSTGSVLGTAVIKLMFVSIMVYLNTIFIVRRFVLMVIYVFTPIVAWLWAINKNVNAMGIWMGELLSNAFMQTAYAIAMLIFLTVNADLRIGEGTWLTLLITMGAIAPVGEMLRNSLQGLWTRLSGVDESLIANRGTMGLMGLGSVVNLGQAVAGKGSPGITFGSPGGFSPESSAGFSPGGSGGFSPGGSVGLSSGGVPGGGALPGTVSPGLSFPGAALGSGPAGQVFSGAVQAGTDTAVPGSSGGLVILGPDGRPISSGATGGEPSGGIKATYVPSRGARVPQVMATGAAVAGLAARAVAPMAALSFAAMPGGDRLARTAVEMTAAGARFAGSAAGGALAVGQAAKEQGSFWGGLREVAGVETGGFKGNFTAVGKLMGYSAAPGIASGISEVRRSWSADGGLRA